MGDELGDHVGNTDDKAAGLRAFERLLQLAAEGEDLVGIVEDDAAGGGEGEAAT